MNKIISFLYLLVILFSLLNCSVISAKKKVEQKFIKLELSLIVDDLFLKSLSLVNPLSYDEFSDLFNPNNVNSIPQIITSNKNYLINYYCIGYFDIDKNTKAFMFCYEEKDTCLNLSSKTIGLIATNNKDYSEYFTLFNKRNVFFDPIESVQIRSLVFSDGCLLIQEGNEESIYRLGKSEIDCEEKDYENILNSNFNSLNIESSLKFHYSNFISIIKNDTLVDLIGVYPLKNDKTIVLYKETITELKSNIICQVFNGDILVDNVSIGELECGEEGQIIYFKKFKLEYKKETIKINTNDIYGRSTEFEY